MEQKSDPKASDFYRPSEIITCLGHMRIGIILPTRGVVFTEVEDSLSRNLEGYDYKIYRSWDLKIPDSDNTLVDKALQEGCDMLLFCEEDTVMPEGGLKRLLEANADIACIDYGVSGYSCITRDMNTSEILWCGLGCTLVKRNVFEALDEPYFKDDRLLLNYWPEIVWKPAGWQEYGGHDIYFFVKAREKGFKIVQVDGECKHLKLEELGRVEVNNGLHKIVQKPVISKYQTL